MTTAMTKTDRARRVAQSTKVETFRKRMMVEAGLRYARHGFAGEDAAHNAIVLANILAEEIAKS